MVSQVIEGFHSALLHPVSIFAIGVILIVFLLVKLQLPAFFGLLISTYIIGLIAPEVPLDDVVSTIGTEFGTVVGDIGILIFMAAIIGKTLTESGAAERIVRGLMSTASQNRPEVALLGSSYVLSVPVWFDNVFYLLGPIARAMRVRTGNNLTLYICALAAGGVATHSFVPPTPGPIAVASELGVDLAIAIPIGAVIALTGSLSGGLIYSRWLNQQLDIPVRDVMGTTQEDLEAVVDTPTEKLPGIFEASLPVILAIVLITGQAILAEFFPNFGVVGAIMEFIGEPDIALTLAAKIGRAHV